MNEQTIKQLKDNAKAIFADTIAEWEPFARVELLEEVKVMECSDGIVAWCRYNGEYYRLVVAQSEEQEITAEEVRIKLAEVINGDYITVLNSVLPLRKVREQWLGEGA